MRGFAFFDGLLAGGVTIRQMTDRHIVDVHLLLLRDRQVLLSRRRDPSPRFDGLWHLPSGKLDAGESVLDAAVREIQEEIGVTISHEDLRLVHTHHANGCGVEPRLGLFFEVRRWTGDPVNREPAKCSELAWFDLDDLPTDIIDYPAAGIRAYLQVQPFGQQGWPGVRHQTSRVVHTADLDSQTVAAAQALLHDAFDGDWSDDDWEHCLGGMHALLWDDGDLIAHGSVVQRRLLHDGRALRAGYIEGVAVRADKRGQGHGATIMDSLERVVRDAYDLGALSASEEALDFYAARGWQLWLGPSAALTPKGIERTEDDDGGIYVLPLALPLDLTGEIVCDWRDGDVW
jgi:aminoglycoside 2'-N-acetyltransferase I